MPLIRLKYVVEDIDRHGNVRRYFRRKGDPKIRLRGLPGSEEFMAAYREALSGIELDKKQQRVVTRGSFAYLCQRYFGSSTFMALDASTQSWRRRSLNLVCEKHGDKPIALMRGKHVRMLRDEKAAFPGAARNRLKALRALFRWAVETNEAPHDPTIGVDPIPYATRGHHSWAIDEVDAYERRHPIGTKARLARLALQNEARTPCYHFATQLGSTGRY